MSRKQLLQKVFALVFRTLFKFKQNVLLFTPAARVSFAAGDADKMYMFFSSFSLQSGKAREIQEGTSWRVSWTLLAA